MPGFDEWGLRPASLTGPRENPVMVTSLLVTHGGPSSSGRAGRHGPPEAEGAPTGVTMPGGTPEGAAPEARTAATGGVGPLPTMSVVEAPGAPAILLGEVTGGVHQGDAPDARHLDASSSSQADPCAQLLGRFCMDFEALRKRQKYFAIDE